MLCFKDGIYGTGRSRIEKYIIEMSIFTYMNKLSGYVEIELNIEHELKIEIIDFNATNSFAKYQIDFQVIRCSKKSLLFWHVPTNIITETIYF